MSANDRRSVAAYLLDRAAQYEAGASSEVALRDLAHDVAGGLVELRGERGELHREWADRVIAGRGERGDGFCRDVVAHMLQRAEALGGAAQQGISEALDGVISGDYAVELRSGELDDLLPQVDRMIRAGRRGRR